jgi:Glycosyl hydrolase family 79 C-terminal beta domain
VRRREGRIRLSGERTVTLVIAAAACVLALAAATAGPARADETTLSAQVGDTPSGQQMPQGFVGISFEYKAMHVYTGRDPTHVNPVLVQLLRGINPQQSPVLRIGGDSTDQTWWPVRGVIPPGGINYALTKGWFRTTQALASVLGARLIMGVNLATLRPALAAAEARSILQGIGSQYIDALEVGNEPDLYPIFAWYRDRRGRVVFSRPRSYSFADYLKDFSHWHAALPNVPLAGPALSSVTWMGALDQFLTAEPSVGVVTFHRYPLRGCTTDTTSPQFASVANLMLDQASAGLAQQVASYVTVAHAHGAQFRLDELNSASCRGRFGVSNTAASALWALDTLFNMAAVGVDGVNIHTLPNAPYEPFTFTHRGSTWSAFVHPIYYGLMMFAQAFPPGAQLLPVTAPAGPVKVWATLGADGHTRVVVINKQNATPVSVTLQLPGSQTDMTASTLQAPTLNAVIGVTLAGQTFGLKTTTGILPGAPQTSAVSSQGGSYSVLVPPASAMLLTR